MLFSMSLFKPRAYSAGDSWGGLAAMLVAFPSAIAFGVAVYSGIGTDYASHGALAGIVGVVVIGLVAALLGGTDRLISAPCAPAAAVLSAFAIEMIRQGSPPSVTMTLLILVGILAGLVQLGLGIVGVGKLIKYIPYPVVSGYLTGVGLIIIGSQIPKFAGITDGSSWWQVLSSPAYWDWRALLIGLATASVALLAPRMTKRVPGIILGILAGVLVYFGISVFQPELRDLHDNRLVIGTLSVSGDGYFSSLFGQWVEIGHFNMGHMVSILGTALTLGVLLSIDTLKTCVVLDKLTRSRHDSNRELTAQGVANIAANALGGMSGAGQMGATLVGLNSGSSTRRAGVAQGIFSLLAAMLLSSFIAWIPVATLASILIVIGVKMIDREPMQFIRSRAMVFDFGVVLAVVLVALTVGLIAASAVGVGLAIILFVREQIGAPVVRHKMELSQTSSSWYRPEWEMKILEQKGHQAVVFELQGNLFFGNTYQLYSDLEEEILSRAYVIIDMHRVPSIDITAAELFKQIRATIKERGAKLVLSGIRERPRSGSNLREFLSDTGLWTPESRTVRVFSDLDGAIAWVEDRLLGEAEVVDEIEEPMQLNEMEIFSRHRDETLKNLEIYMEIRRYAPGELIYERGTPGDHLFWVRRGAVRLISTLEGGKKKPVATFGRGDFFGGLSFLDGQSRPNDAVAVMSTELYALSSVRFNQIATEHKKLAFNLAMSMARMMATRLRRNENKLTMLQEY